jgi:hypothetical protein
MTHKEDALKTAICQIKKVLLIAIVKLLQPHLLFSPDLNRISKSREDQAMMELKVAL